MFGLLDSGASLSVLGKGSEKFISDIGATVTKCDSTIQTADGSMNRIIGCVTLPVSYMGSTELLKFCIVPSLQSEVYLGVDFWKIFKIAPQIISEVNFSSGSDVSEKVLHILTTDQKTRLDEVVSSFPSFESKGLGRTNLVEHVINVENAVPIKQRHYSVSPAVQFQIYDELDRMLSLGVIEESSSPWSSPIVIVSKSNGKKRLCLDSRKINLVTKKDAYPLPIIDGLLGRLQDTKFITSLDLKDAFWQIPLSQSSKEITAFTVPGRPLYQFCVMPFGLCNAPQTMSRLMDRVIPHQLRDRVFVYLDDLLIISAEYDEHLQILRTVAELLEKAGLTINIDKSHFMLRETKYLGFIVGEHGLKTDPSKVEAIKSFPVPTTVKQTRRFLGMAGWYRRFIPNYSEITAPITNLLRKGLKFKWNDDADSAFETLKEMLCCAPVLHNPDFCKEFYIRCDASTQGIGSVLFQKDDNGNERPIIFMSQKLNQAQRNYSVTELECLAAVVGIKKFRPYIEGYRFTLITDHASLKWLMNQKDLSGRLARWSLKLQGFNFNIVHQKGSENIVPDALSRIYCETIKEIHADAKFIEPNLFDSTKILDPAYLNILLKIRSDPASYPNLQIYEDKLYIRIEPKRRIPLTDIPIWKLWIPSDIRKSIIASEHNPPDAAHGGIKKTIERLRRLYYWPKMANEIHDYIIHCDICKQTKAMNTCGRPPLGKQTLPQRPWQKIYIDLLGPYPRTSKGKTMILIVLDHLTKFVYLKALAKGTARLIVSFLQDEFFPLFSVPQIIHSDNGTQFKGEEFTKMVNDSGIEHIKTAYYSPQSNASERVNRSIVAAIRAYLADKHTTWDKFLPQIAGALRNSVHESTGFSPHFLLFGYHYIGHAQDYKLLSELNLLTDGTVDWMSTADRLAIIHEEVRYNLKIAYEKYSKRYNLRTRERSLSVGQKVYVRQHPKSDATKKYIGKFAYPFLKAFVKEKIGNVNYVLTDEKGKILGTYHLMDIKT